MRRADSFGGRGQRREGRGKGAPEGEGQSRAAGRGEKRAGRGGARRPRFHLLPDSRPAGCPGKVFLHVSPTNQTHFALGWKIGNRLISTQSGKRNASKGKGTKRGQPKSGGLLVYVSQPASPILRKRTESLAGWISSTTSVIP